jgi:hypothetical protein
MPPCSSQSQLEMVSNQEYPKVHAILKACSCSFSASSAISFESESTREPTLEYDPIAAYEVCASLHWDVEEWDF